MKRFWIFLLPLIVTVSASAQSVNVHLSGRTVLGSLPKMKVASAQSGVVVVNINVDQYGNVTEDIPGVEGTTVTDKVLWTAARNAAMKAHFNQKADAPAVQQGTITYHFLQNEWPSIGSGSGHMLFKGIEIDGDYHKLVQSLKEQGYELVSIGEQNAHLTGLFMGINDVDISVLFNPYTQKAVSVNVYFPSTDDRDGSFQDALSKYKLKYGDPTSCTEARVLTTFSFPASENCTDEKHEAMWCFKEGIIILKTIDKVFHNGVSVSYLDRINVEERKQNILNDI